MRLRIFVCLAVGVHATSAQPIRLALRGGTLGAGVEMTASLTSRVDVRVAGHYGYLNTRRSSVRGGLALESTGSASSGTFGLATDFWLGHRASFSVGLYSMITGGTLRVRPAAGAELADAQFTTEDLGSSTATARYPERPAPYVGLRTSHRLLSRLNLLTEVGALYTGRPKIEVTGEGRFSASAGWTGHLKDAFRQASWFPVLSIGVQVQVNAPTH